MTELRNRWSINGLVWLKQAAKKCKAEARKYIPNKETSK